MIKAEYEVAAEELFKGEPSLRIGEVDCTEEEELCRKYSVRAYPHLTLFKYGQPFPLKVEKGSDYTDAVKE